MKSRTTTNFRKLYRALPAQLRKQAGDAYKRWQIAPRASGIRFKQLGGKDSYYSARVNQNYRVVGELRGDTIYWDFIGNHVECMRYIENL